MNTTTRRLLALLLLSLVGCSTSTPEPSQLSQEPHSSPETLTSREAAKTRTSFGSYWYQGLAELNRYALRQSRYGELHQGEAVLLFVTEDFLTEKQVKHEFGEGPSVSVLKLNAYRRFYTGLYPYTIMTSVFSPAGSPQTPLKSATSVQEWCGHTYTQANLRDGQYQLKGHSYFQAEGDWSTAFDVVLFEDGLWNQIRRDPGSLPTGDHEVLPGAHHLSMRHKPFAPIPATLTLSDAAKTDWSEVPVRTYAIRYPSQQRTVEIFFEEAFPHLIVAWQETAGGLTTTAKLTHSILEDYWSHNGVGDGKLRKSLGLEH